VGGSWAKDLDAAAPSSPYLAFVVGLHVATAIGMLFYFWRDWLRIIGAFFTSLRYRVIENSDQRLAWMIILIINGIILFCAERFRRPASLQADADVERERELADSLPARVGAAPTARVG